MRGDFSRDTFDPVKHFSRVLQQQGRVQLDADTNESSAILMHFLRTLAADLIGPFAGPKGEGLGFAIGEVEDGSFPIGPGRYYVDGILCENHEGEVGYLTQKDYPAPPELDPATSYIVYLDVWERHVTALEDDAIREKALGGSDTTTRAKVVWQVKLVDLPDNMTNHADVRAGWGGVVQDWKRAHAGCLRAKLDQPDSSASPCLTAPDARYRGAENQLYRIEIHEGGKAGVATFKWSRNNGSVAVRVSGAGTELTGGSGTEFAAEQWVELTSDAQELRGEPGVLVKLADVDGERLTLKAELQAPEVPEGEAWPTKACGWDHRKIGKTEIKNGAIPVTEDEKNWILIENGIQIQFLPSGDPMQDHVYRTGDYWLIPARVATGDIEWPRDDSDTPQPLPRPPVGVRHHYAPLAILTANSGAWTVDDCRCSFPPLSYDCQEIESAGEEGLARVLPC